MKTAPPPPPSKLDGKTVEELLEIVRSCDAILASPDRRKAPRMKTTSRYPSRFLVESLDEYVARVWAREAGLVAAETAAAANPPTEGTPR